jgi:Ca2+-binding RTX toxin-like protein
VSRSVSILSVMVMMTVAVIATVAVAFATQNGGGTGQEKVSICHKGKNTITVGAPARDAHLRHGDKGGPCSTTPETTPPEETTLSEEATLPDTEGGAGQEKVTICHKDKKTIVVGKAALDAHLDHGDTEGLCETDTTDGTNGSDEIAGGLGNDLIRSSLGDDHLYGDSAADELYGQDGDDFLQSGLGPDQMFGGAGSDYVDGADGIGSNDVLNGGIGTDHCVGDEGDTFRNCDGNVFEVTVPSLVSAPMKASR